MVQKIKRLSDHIKEEIEDARAYVDHALACQESDPEVADLYCRLAEEELSHMTLLHKQVVRIIEQYRRENGEPPANMLERYNLLHEIHVENANAVKLRIRIYREG